MGLFGGNATAPQCCIGCGRLPANIPESEVGDDLAAASFYPSKAPARGRVVMCRTCAREVTSAFAQCAAAGMAKIPKPPAKEVREAVAAALNSHRDRPRHIQIEEAAVARVRWVTSRVLAKLPAAPRAEIVKLINEELASRREGA